VLAKTREGRFSPYEAAQRVTTVGTGVSVEVIKISRDFDFLQREWGTHEDS
jgi:hypothetical protein